MNRIMGLILAFSAITVVGCASAGGAGNGAAPSKAASAGQFQKPSENRMTREASRNLGLALLRTEPEEQRPFFEQALSSAVAATEAEPQNPLGWMLAGQAHAKLRNFSEADAAFERAVELFPEYEAEIDVEREEAWVDAYNVAIGAYQEGDMDGAILGMENAGKIYQKRPEAFHILGSFYANGDEGEKAIDAFQSALKIIRNPDLAPEDEELQEQWTNSEEEIVTNLGLIMNALDRASDSEKVYREYLERNPGHLESEVNLAVSLTMQEKTEEANEVFTRLASRDDLSSDHLLMVGIGMYNADNFDAAADAFRSATEKNPYSRDAYLNLVKALLRESLDLEDEYRENESSSVASDLAKVYKEMIAASEKTIDLDPFNREVYTYTLRSYQGLSQLVTEESNRESHQGALQSALKSFEGLPFEVSNISMQAAESEVMISGSVMNLKLEEGTPVTLRFTAISANGAELGSENVTVTAGAAETTAVPFRVAIPVSAEMEGWKYERVQ